MLVHIDDKNSLDASCLGSIIGTELRKTIFLNRGVDDKEIDIEDVYDPAIMLDASVAADTIIKHIRAGNHIVFYSDYDADGFASAVAGVEMTREAGGIADWYTNKRSYGYGANKKGVEELLSKFSDVSLVVTTDNGIVAFDAVDQLTNAGVEVVVTDHHQPSSDGRIPSATAVVNPHRHGDPYPFKGLCGAGVIWKVMMLVYQRMGINKEVGYKSLDVVALATVGDVVPLVDENRTIVKYGLSLINSGHGRSDWEILKKVNSVFGYEITNVDARTISFTFVPQINACSRIDGDISPALDMFFSARAENKTEKAEYIKNVNEARKEMTSDETERAYSLCSRMSSSPVIVISGKFTDGIVGLIAGRIKEAFNTPTIVLAPDDSVPGVLKGSGRSIPGFPMKTILDEISAETDGILTNYGGHDMACGCSIYADSLDSFRAALTKKAVKYLRPDDYVLNIPIDVDISDSGTIGFITDVLDELEPYGCQFEAPIIRLKDFIPNKIEAIGKEKQHLKMTGNNLTVISWNGWEDYVNNGEPRKVTCIGRLERKKHEVNLICEGYLIVPA